jgi:hypothetical protein
MKVDHHISDLLYDHDCVIVPEMGGFIASYSHARINTAQQMVEPPSKKIAFNIFLTHNDGLLAEHIARYENLNFNEALNEIRGYVHNYQEEIDSGKKFVIKEVGVLYADAGRNVQFEPFKNINYLKDSFGLATVHSVLLEKGLKSRKPADENRESFGLNRKSKIETQKTNSGKMANTLLLVGSIFWFLLNLYFVAPTKMDFASLNPFNHQSTAHIPHSTISGHQFSTEHGQPTAVRVETVYVKSVESSRKDSVLQAPGSSSNDFQSKKTENNFYIVGGAFRSLKNATRFENELKTQGFTEAKIIDSSTSLKMVSLGSYASREAAVTELNRLKAEKRDVWIYRR